MFNPAKVGQLKSNAPDVDTVRIRTSPDLTSDFVSKPVGTRVMVTDQTLGADPAGFYWYRVTFDGTEDGWVRDDVIDVSTNPTPSPSPTPTPTPSPTPNPIDARTRLFFETDTRQVRVFEEGVSVFMNIYNKKTASTELNHVFATKLSGGDSRGWENYLSTKDGRAYQASMIRRGATQLKITNSSTGLDVEPIESGFKAWGTEYQ